MEGTRDKEALKDAVRLYCDIHDSLQRTAEETKKLKQQKDELGDTILVFMRNEGIDELELVGGGKLVRRESKKTASLSKEYLLEELKKVVDDPARAEAILQNVYSNRPVEIKDALSRRKT